MVSNTYAGGARMRHSVLEAASNGKLFATSYTLGARLGSGSYSVVHRCIHKYAMCCAAFCIFVHAVLALCRVTRTSRQAFAVKVTETEHLSMETCAALVREVDILGQVRAA